MLGMRWPGCYRSDGHRQPVLPTGHGQPPSVVGWLLALWAAVSLAAVGAGAAAVAVVAVGAAAGAAVTAGLARRAGRAVAAAAE